MMVPRRRLPPRNRDAGANPQPNRTGAWCAASQTYVLASALMHPASRLARVDEESWLGNMVATGLDSRWIELSEQRPTRSSHSHARRHNQAGSDTALCMDHMCVS
eukprot:3218338-Rhodomonas_salina.2